MSYTPQMRELRKKVEATRPQRVGNNFPRMNPEQKEDVLKKFHPDFIEASISNREGSVREPGNLRFDVLQAADEPTRFLLYEAYDSEESAARHKETDHYVTWRDRVAEWMAEPRIGVRYRSPM